MLRWPPCALALAFSALALTHAVACYQQGLEYEVRGAKVEKADIECSNGVIHVIDSVMIPDVKYCGV